MIERIFFRQHYSFIFHPVYMYVRYRSMTLSDTCTIRRSWTLHAVPGLPVVAWGEHGNILLAHYDRDSCEKSAWKYRGNIVRWTWILQRFNEERNPFLICGKTWLIITFRCVYCTVMILSLWTALVRSGHRVQTQIRLLQEEQCDQDLHCLQFCLLLLDSLLYGKAILFKF